MPFHFTELYCFPITCHHRCNRYTKTHLHFIEDGIDFWWNDEGETFYFAFHYWNMAQIEGLTKFNPTKRFWSIDRSYTIGMSRLGAVIWTGDINVAWDALAQQPGTMLNWVRV